jgi:hypothetical protein
VDIVDAGSSTIVRRVRAVQSERAEQHLHRPAAGEVPGRELSYPVGCRRPELRGGGLGRDLPGGKRIPRDIRAGPVLGQPRSPAH